MNRFAPNSADHSIALRRARTEILQVNVGKLCNLTCVHCHVNAGPRRKEIISRETVDRIIDWFRNDRHSHTRSHRRRAGNDSRLSLRHRARCAPFPLRRRIIDRLQSLDPARSGARWSRRVFGGKRNRDHRLDAVLSAGECERPAR
jgi:hypothetical protein